MAVIKIENLWKQYRLGVIGHGTLQADLQSWWARKWGKEDPNAKITAMYKGQEQQVEGDRFWALRDINLEVQQGEILGIIGKNGAGKSTLLKILSRVTAPTRGEVKVKGRIASLLEVGTGFHPELTGRENVFLNGAILGMTKAEIRSKFDEIVDFSGVEQFIDTPVKRYSSGMKVRLAFAVAAHLEPEILVVDEVLAVGDAEFQRKCLGKMGDVASAGRTVLFVSHNMASVNQLCPICAWLDNGRVRKIGESSEIIREYISEIDVPEDNVELVYPLNEQYKAQLRKVRLCDQHGEAVQSFECDEPVVIELIWQVHQKVSGIYGYLWIKKPDYTQVLVSDSHDSPPNPFDELDPGIYRVVLAIPARTLAPGNYLASVTFKDNNGLSPDVHAPSIIGRFTLMDHTTRRGNKRTGFFSTIIHWDVTPAALPEAN